MAYHQRPAEHDTKCPDGFTCYGWRRVNHGGCVRFAHGRHYHEDLIQLVGQWVYVTLADMWGINVDVWPNRPWVGESWSCSNETEWNAEKTPTPVNAVTPSLPMGPSMWPFVQDQHEKKSVAMEQES